MKPTDENSCAEEFLILNRTGLHFIYLFIFLTGNLIERCLYAYAADRANAKITDIYRLFYFKFYRLFLYTSIYV